MDQLKVFLNEAVKHRFWIAIGISALLPLIAWFASSGALGEETKAGEAKAKSAYDGVKKYVSGPIKNGQWAQKVQEKTEVVKKDVNASWRKLYARQAPLLSWPKRVEPVFMEWGRTYPEGVDPQRVRDVVLEYTQDYPAYVDEVYSTFKPFDYDEGTGIVAAAPKEVLLQPQVFRESSPPSLGEVWSAQEKLWIQRTLLDVIAKVNDRAGAKDWDGAIVKQIVGMEIANPLALDQKNEPKASEVLEEAPDILPPGASADAGSASSSSEPERGFGVAAGPAGASEKLLYVKSPNPDQYFIVPIALDVLVEQDHINDLLVEFANSPMSIQILDFEFLRPVTPVQKPRKGEVQESGGGGAGYPGMGGYAGRSGMGSQMMGGSQGMMNGGYNPGMGGSSGSMAAGSRTGGMFGAGAGGAANKNEPAREGQKVLDKNIEKFRQKQDKSKKDEKTVDEPPVISNPYVNVVEVRIKGQARFYKTPPAAEPAPEPTSPQAEEEPKAEEPKADAPKAEEPKADAPKAEEPKAEEPKAEEPKKDEAPKPDAPKIDPSPSPATGQDNPPKR